MTADLFGAARVPPRAAPSARRVASWPATRVMDGHVIHLCARCGADASFGFGVLAGRPGTWFCVAHKGEAP